MRAVLVNHPRMLLGLIHLCRITRRPSAYILLPQPSTSDMCATTHLDAAASALFGTRHQNHAKWMIPHIPAMFTSYHRRLRTTPCFDAVTTALCVATTQARTASTVASRPPPCHTAAHHPPHSTRPTQVTSNRPWAPDPHASTAPPTPETATCLSPPPATRLTKPATHPPSTTPAATLRPPSATPPPTAVAGMDPRPERHRRMGRNQSAAVAAVTGRSRAQHRRTPRTQPQLQRTVQTAVARLG